MFSTRRLLSVLLVSVLALSAVRVPGLAQSAQERAKEKSLYVKLLRSSTWVVVLKTLKPGAIGFHEGSGWVVNGTRKLVVTNYHVVGKDKEVQVFFPYYVNNQALTARKPYVNLIAQNAGNPGTVIAVDKARDLAVIQLRTAPTWIKSLPIAAQGVLEGDRVYNLGNPGGENSLWQFSSSKVLNVRKRELQSKMGDGELKINAVIVETDDKKVRKGQSGSLLVNPRGELVGVIQSIAQTEPQTTMAVERSEVLDFLRANNIKPLMAAEKKKKN